VSYLGRGYESIPGKPFGWAWHRERDEIRAHLRRRLWRFVVNNAEGLPVSVRLEYRVTQIQERIHRNKPTYAQRCAARAATRSTYVPPPSFTRDELERMVEHFAGSNDAVGASIASKARELLL
jgi:hypothetical protein